LAAGSAAVTTKRSAVAGDTEGAIELPPRTPIHSFKKVIFGESAFTCNEEMAPTRTDIDART